MSKGDLKKQQLLISLAIVILLLTVVPQVQGTQGLQTTSITLQASGRINRPQIHSVGVNYLSTMHLYSNIHNSNETLQDDFQRFKVDGLNTIALSLYWYKLEGNTKGDYNGTLPNGITYGDPFLNDVKRVIQIANESGIKVMVTFATLWGNDSLWCTPSYVVDPLTNLNDGLAIVRDDGVRQAFINMFNHTVRYLAGTPGIWSWAILNEPWYWGSTTHDYITKNGKTQKENFITLIQTLSNIVKIEDGQPVTVKFCDTWVGLDSTENPIIKNIFTDDWEWDPRIFNTIDFVSFTTYLPFYDELYPKWVDMTIANINGSKQLNKQVWIAEFGSTSDNETKQAADYKGMLSLFASVQVSGCLAWQWARGDVKDTVSQGAFNLCSDIYSGATRPAYTVLCSYSK
jgi:hypothetical protein